MWESDVAFPAVVGESAWGGRGEGGKRKSQWLPGEKNVCKLRVLLRSLGSEAWKAGF